MNEPLTESVTSARARRIGETAAELMPSDFHLPNHHEFLEDMTNSFLSAKNTPSFMPRELVQYQLYERSRRLTLIVIERNLFFLFFQGKVEAATLAYFKLTK